MPEKMYLNNFCLFIPILASNPLISYLNIHLTLVSNCIRLWDRQMVLSLASVERTACPRNVKANLKVHLTMHEVYAVRSMSRRLHEKQNAEHLNTVVTCRLRF